MGLGDEKPVKEKSEKGATSEKQRLECHVAYYLKSWTLDNKYGSFWA